VTTKETDVGAGNGLTFAVSSMQGWRNTMEDAHCAIVDIKELPGCSFFAVFDGHAGSFVSTRRSVAGSLLLPAMRELPPHVLFSRQCFMFCLSPARAARLPAVARCTVVHDAAGSTQILLAGRFFTYLVGLSLCVAREPHAGAGARVLHRFYCWMHSSRMLLGRILELYAAPTVRCVNLPGRSCVARGLGLTLPSARRLVARATVYLAACAVCHRPALPM
jgi:hypothetical protein